MKYFLVLFVCFDILHNKVTISSRYEDVQRKEDVPEPFNSNTESFEILKEPNNQYKVESIAGDVTDLLGSNVHYRQSGAYDDHARRFLMFGADKKKSNPENENLVPMKAPPELVLAVAKLSANQANSVHDPLEELAKRSVARSGDYWDGVWKEEVVIPTNNILRVKEKSKDIPIPSIGTVKAKVSPGSRLYRLISVLQQFSPRLLYVVNKE